MQLAGADQALDEPHMLGPQFGPPERRPTKKPVLPTQRDGS